MPMPATLTTRDAKALAERLTQDARNRGPRRDDDPRPANAKLTGRVINTSGHPVLNYFKMQV
jgi:hypothetical protein